LFRFIAADGKKFDLVGKGQVLYDFEPRTTQELGLKKKQIVNIISKAGNDHGWWKGEYNGKVGVLVYFASMMTRY